MGLRVDSVSGRRMSIPSSVRARGGSGLGDSIYLRAIAEEVIRLGSEVTVFSDWPDVFIGSSARVEPFCRNRMDIVAHYIGGKTRAHTNQWEDICAASGVQAPLTFPWEVQNPALVARVMELAAGRHVVLVHGGREPMGRKDGFGRELLPRRDAFERVLAALADCFLVRIGAAPEIYPVPCHMDLNGGTSVSDLLDLGSSCAGIVGQCSFAIPLAEVFDRPFLGVWSSAGMRSREVWVRLVTPRKILSKPTSRAVVDDEAPEAITGKALDFLAALGERVAAGEVVACAS